MSDEQPIHVNGVDLCVETFGDSADPAILLIMGGAASMDYWADEFCARLAAGARHVIRYDHRDTGRSVSYEPGTPAYTFTDLVADAAGLLDAQRVDRTHLVGMSMGGAIAQTLAVERPERVASLVLMSTSSIEPVERQLPSMSDELRARFDAPPPEPDWDDRQAVIDYLVEGERPFLGTVRSDDLTLRERAGRVVDRTTNIASSQTNHWILDAGYPVQGKLADVTAPTLVFHGTEDPLFPYEHGEALVEAIPGAHLVPLVGVGHEAPPRAVWGEVVPAILRHTDPTSARGDAT